MDLKELRTYFVIEEDNYYGPTDGHIVYCEGKELSYMDEQNRIFYYDGSDHVEIKNPDLSTVHVYKSQKTIQDVHTGHCCKRCGCRYGDSSCTVLTGKAKAEYGCRDCYDEGIYDNDYILPTFAKDDFTDTHSLLNALRDRYRSGDHMSTETIELALPDLAKTRDTLFGLGDEFRLAWAEINHMVIRLEDYLRARRNK